MLQQLQQDEPKEKEAAAKTKQQRRLPLLLQQLWLPLLLQVTRAGNDKSAAEAAEAGKRAFCSRGSSVLCKDKLFIDHVYNFLCAVSSN